MMTVYLVARECDEYPNTVSVQFFPRGVSYDEKIFLDEDKAKNFAREKTENERKYGGLMDWVVIPFDVEE